jgi:Tol biopolymer transport system component
MAFSSYCFLLPLYCALRNCKSNLNRAKILIEMQRGQAILSSALYVFAGMLVVYVVVSVIREKIRSDEWTFSVDHALATLGIIVTIIVARSTTTPTAGPTITQPPSPTPIVAASATSDTPTAMPVPPTNTRPLPTDTSTPELPSNTTVPKPTDTPTPEPISIPIPPADAPIAALIDVPASVSIGGHIVFESERDGNWEVYIMNFDGSDQTNLTDNTATDGDPTLSQDGKRVAFTSNRDGNPEIYVMNVDGSGVRRLTNHSAFDVWPTWSPDGTRIAFTSNRDGKYSGIYVMNADGSGLTRLTNFVRPSGPLWVGGGLIGDAYPAWSPDGTNIAFSSYRDGEPEIYVMNADGNGMNRLTTNQAHEWFGPSWSPDGTHIAFKSNRDGNDEIYVMNADGSGQTRLTNNPANDREPSWSPDGLHIVFESDRDGDWEIYKMNADGNGQTRLTNKPGYDSNPSWAPKQSVAGGLHPPGGCQGLAQQVVRLCKKPFAANLGRGLYCIFIHFQTI